MRIKSWRVDKRLVIKGPLFRITVAQGNTDPRYAIRYTFIDFFKWTLRIYWTDKHYVRIDNHRPTVGHIAEIARVNAERSK